MPQLPIREPIYAAGSSTPRSFRPNNALWHDFCRIARVNGYRPSELLRFIMEDFVVGATARMTRHIEHEGKIVQLSKLLEALEVDPQEFDRRISSGNTVRQALGLE